MGGKNRDPFSIPREALSALGPVCYSRRAWRCKNPDCGAFVAPLDRELGLQPKQHVTLGAREKMALVGATDSYVEAALKLDRIAGLPACAKEVQRITVQEGKRAEALLEAQEKEARRLAATPAEKHDTVVLEMDGTCVLTQPPGPRKRKQGEGETAPEKTKKRQGKEIKCATAFGLDQRASAPARPMLSGRRYIANAKGIEAFAAPLFALLLAVGGMRARRIVIIGDGAAWIWTWVKNWLSAWGRSGKEIVEIVDFWHAAERLSSLSNKLFGEGSEAARQWFDTWRHRLKHGQIDGLIEEMEALQENWKAGKKRKACEDQLHYFRDHRERMRYDRFAQSGLPIGSGAIEGTCKCLVKKRMAASGMHSVKEKPHTAAGR